MTKKDYELIGETMRWRFEAVREPYNSAMTESEQQHALHELRCVVNDLGLKFRQNDPKFNMNKWDEICGIDEPEETGLWDDENNIL